MSALEPVNFDQSQVLRTLGINASDPNAQALLLVCQRYELDPLLKHMQLIKGTPYITRDGYLHVAHSSGQLDGIVVEQEPTLSEDGTEWVARVSVYRKDMRHPFTYPGRYSVTGSNREYAQEMALKAAEAHALRRAFNVEGLPALDEQRPEVEQQRVRAADVVAPSPEPEPEPPADEVVDGEVVDADAEAAAQAAAETEDGGR